MALILLPDDIPGCLEEAGLTLGRIADDEAWALCPAHYRRLGREDHSPNNFSVNLETGMAYCFSCGYRDTLNGLIARELFNGDVWQASGWLKERGADLREAVGRIERRVTQSKMRGTRLEDPDFRFVVFDEPPPYALEDRDVSRESVERFRVRWDPANQSWVIPFIGFDGRVKGWQVKEGRYFNNYPKTVRSREFLFGSQQVEEGRPLVVVESPLDVLRLFTAGVSNGVATFGVEVSDEQIEQILDLSQHVILALDDDAPGWAKTDELIETLSRRAIVSIFNYGDSGKKDPGEMDDDLIAEGLATAVPAALIPRRT